MTSFKEQFPSLADWLEKKIISNSELDELMNNCLDKQKIWFYRCANCKKETFSDMNNNKEPYLCVDCNYRLCKKLGL